MSAGDSASELQLVLRGADTFIFREGGGKRKNMAAKHTAKLWNTPL